jgi:hypothetical protein
MPLRPVTAMARWLGHMYIAVGGAAAMMVAALLNRSRALDDLSGRLDSGEIEAAGIDEALEGADAFVAIASAALVVSGIAVFVLLVAWAWRMDRNMRALGEAPRLPGALAIAGWFVPIANLVVPYLFVRDYVRGLAAVAPRLGRTVRTGDYRVAAPWWAGQFALLLFSGGPGQERTAAGVAELAGTDRGSAVGLAIFVVSAACGTMTFRRFSRDSFDTA